jgi:dTDP-4-dehydrorhamnose 3,5-epimerase
VVDGVVIKKLVTHKDQRGFFREVIRFPSEFAEVPVGQISHSFVNEGVFKGWHAHENQHQWNYVVRGKINVVLLDDRQNSKTYRQFVEFAAGDEEPVSYYFPPGVLHAYKCIKGPMEIIYITSGIYDPTEEIRISTDEFKHIYDWKESE